ncbi:hybrid sensor histidine kinase/response regulator [Paraburkholderia sp. UYCP14C]|uniref:ATP-binding response regulator n=1 Tax=Paraburkholderia sp. UYCP14C TaxID=2511130 RepID=UPI001021A6D7|nr:response regulator [Paraburkholderia sp. UYCP14C]RZF31262.1 hybrid sensor histidine kinase/response regulator [Paraburkholderia sp. UYCP14C]
MQTHSRLEDGQANILVVDDVAQQHLVLRSVLDELGENIVTVSSGRDALAAVLETEFAVILLDVNMPGMDGLETASMMRSYRRTARTPIIFITAYVDETEMARGYSLGAVDYISSPVIPEILRAKVRVFVDMYRMRNQLIARAAEREELAKAEAQRAAAEQARHRADFLARASQALTRSLEADATVGRIVELPVPALADAAVLVFTAGEGLLPRTIAYIAPSAYADPRSGDAGGLHHQFVPLPELDELVRQALSTGRPAHLAIMGRPVLAVIDDDGTCRDLPLALDDITAYPLLIDAAQPSAIVLGMRRSSERIEDALMTREFVSRAAIALENALLFSTIRDGDRRKNEFLAMLAHELRNPLAPIVNAVAVLRGAKQMDAQTVRWASDIIGTQAEHLVRIVDDLLDVSRIARGVVTLRSEPVLLSTVIERAMQTSGPNFARRSQTLICEASKVDVVIDGDIVRLSQIVANLLNNASKFTPHGGRAQISTEFDGIMASIVVRDEGDGIDPVFLPHVFELFAQGQTSLDRNQGGLGIGLTLVRHLTEMHQGTVHCESAGRGAGSRFTVRLPARVAPDAVENSAKIVPIRRARSVRVLIVDDMAAAAESLEALLQMHGHQVQRASDGLAALALARTFFPDVILLDIGLPGMSGFEVAQRIRADESLPRSLIIAISGYGQEDHRRRALDAGVDHYLVKPADVDMLLGVIDDYVQSNAAGSGAAA